MPYLKKRKTDRLPKGLVLEYTMKAAVTAVLHGKAVNTVARENPN